MLALSTGKGGPRSPPTRTQTQQAPRGEGDRGPRLWETERCRLLWPPKGWCLSCYQSHPREGSVLFRSG